MMKKLTKLLLIAAILALCIGLMTVTALAADDTYTYSDGTLTILSSAGLDDWKTDGTFAENDVKSLVIGEGVTEIKPTTYGSNSTLKSLTFKGDIILGGAAFYRHTGLETIVFEGESTLTDDAFGQCPGIKEITFAKKTALSGSSLLVFSSSPNQALTSLVFPAGSTIGMGIFRNYHALESVTFEGDVVLEGQAFYLCGKLETIVFKGESTLKDDAFGQCPGIKEITFAKKTALSGSSLLVFSSSPNQALTSLVFPAGSTIAKGNFFSHYNALKTVTFEGDIELGFYDFYDCMDLETVVFGGESTLTDDAFGRCPNIAAITFKGETALSNRAFACLPDAVNEKLTELVLPKNSSLANSCFANFSELETVVFEKGTTIGTGILPGCPAVEEFIFKATTPQNFESCTFTNFEPENIRILVPNPKAYTDELSKDTGDAPDKHYNIEFVDCVEQGESEPETEDRLIIIPFFILDNPFIDVSFNDWFFESVNFVYANELMLGTSKWIFDPNTAITRGMLTTILARLNGVDTNAGKTWYEAGMNWALGKGLTDKTDALSPISREEIAVMLYRNAGSPAVSGDLSQFSDASKISAYAKDAMLWAVQQGIFAGMGNGILAPQGNATRAQVATILQRLLVK